MDDFRFGWRNAQYASKRQCCLERYCRWSPHPAVMGLARSSMPGKCIVGDTMVMGNSEMDRPTPTSIPRPF